MSQELQEDLQITNIQALDLDENLPELSFKKSVSQPPPGFVKFKISINFDHFLFTNFSILTLIK